MTWISINPNSLSLETMQVCADILNRDIEQYPFSSTELGYIFNIVDPEVTGLTHSENHNDASNRTRGVKSMLNWLKGKAAVLTEGFDPDKEYDQVLNRTGGETSDEQIDQDVKVFFSKLSPLLELENLDPTTRDNA